MPSPPSTAALERDAHVHHAGHLPVLLPGPRRPQRRRACRARCRQPDRLSAPEGATPLRASLAPAYKPCTAPNRTHGAPLSFASCNPPVQVSNYVTVGIPRRQRDGRQLGRAPSPSRCVSPRGRAVRRLDHRRAKEERPDRLHRRASGEAAAAITDKLNGPLVTENGDRRHDASPSRSPARRPASTTVGSTCSITTTANAITPGAVVDGARAVWELPQRPGLRRRRGRRRLDDRRQHPVRGSGRLSPRRRERADSACAWVLPAQLRAAFVIREQIRRAFVPSKANCELLLVIQRRFASLGPSTARLQTVFSSGSKCRFASLAVLQQLRAAFSLPASTFRASLLRPSKANCELL